MNIFAGNFYTKTDNPVPEIDFDIVKISEKNFFIMGGSEEMQSKQDVLDFIEGIFGEIIEHDISIDTEEQVEILSVEYEQEGYECVSFEGPDMALETIVERFADSGEVACVRESEISKKYGNKIIKADFLF